VPSIPTTGPSRVSRSPTYKAFRDEDFRCTWIRVERRNARNEASYGTSEKLISELDPPTTD
jgi:hypothetical protein